MINRRRFLKLAVAGAAGAFVVPMSLVSARAEQVPWVDTLTLSQETFDLFKKNLWRYQMIVRNHPIAIRELGSRDSAYGHAGLVPADMVDEIEAEGVQANPYWQRRGYDWSNADVKIINPPDFPEFSGETIEVRQADVASTWRSPAWTD